jgi:hypothetical protein
MKSSELTKYGFGVWAAFNRKNESALLSSLPSSPGVYAIRCSKDYTRRVGRSDILYFGSATNQQDSNIDSDSIFIPARHKRRTYAFWLWSVTAPTSNFRLLRRVQFPKQECWKLLCFNNTSPNTVSCPQKISVISSSLLVRVQFYA